MTVRASDRSDQQLQCFPEVSRAEGEAGRGGGTGVWSGGGVWEGERGGVEVGRNRIRLKGACGCMLDSCNATLSFTVYYPQEVRSWEYSCCNTSGFSRYENYCIILVLI